MARHVKTGDLVEIIAGAHKGTRGKILAVLVGKRRDRVQVEGLTVKRHLRVGRDPKYPNGGIVAKAGSVHISNVLPIDPSTDKPTRVGFRRLEDGRKVRFAKTSGEVLE